MKILLAEDDESIQAIAVMSLSRVGHHDVVIAADGPSALEAAVREKPDLILLDVMMPGLDGFQVCEGLTSDERTRGIPVIFLTAKAQMTEMQHGLGLGALGYILKPFDPMTLHRQIEEILKHHAKAA
jgi:CheY-like chemotaxis protein